VENRCRPTRFGRAATRCRARLGCRWRKIFHLVRYSQIKSNRSASRSPLPVLQGPSSVGMSPPTRNRTCQRSGRELNYCFLKDIAPLDWHLGIPKGIPVCGYHLSRSSPAVQRSLAIPGCSAPPTSILVRTTTPGPPLARSRSLRGLVRLTADSTGLFSRTTGGRKPRTREPVAQCANCYFLMWCH